MNETNDWSTDDRSSSSSWNIADTSIEYWSTKVSGCCTSIEYQTSYGYCRVQASFKGPAHEALSSGVYHINRCSSGIFACLGLRRSAWLFWFGNAINEQVKQSWYWFATHNCEWFETTASNIGWINGRQVYSNVHIHGVIILTTRVGYSSSALDSRTLNRGILASNPLCYSFKARAFSFSPRNPSSL